MPILFEDLTRPALESLPKKETLFIIACAPFEDHGPALPLSLDFKVATALSLKIAQELENSNPKYKVVILPALPLGCDSNTDRVRFQVRGTAFRDTLLDWALSLKRMGFQNLGILSGHWGPKQLTAIEEAARYSERRANGLFLMKWRNRSQLFQVCSLSSGLITSQERKTNFALSLPSQHGGTLDQSLYLYLNHPQNWDPPAPQSPPSLQERIQKRLFMREEGYWTDGTKEASALQGQQWLEKKSRELASRWIKVAEGLSLSDAEFRSGYSLFLPNHTTFGTFLWTVGLTAAFLSWTTWIVSFLLTSP
jgi:creatinine amidohydrolase/Fe(II)-dependent formamide hydrolase-like protein